MSFQTHESFIEMEDDEKRKYLFDEKEILKLLFKGVSNFEKLFIPLTLEEFREETKQAHKIQRSTLII